MGKWGAGKTSMRSIIFHNNVARRTRDLGPTIGIESSDVQFLGNLSLNLWDCGGQDKFFNNYLTTQSHHVFKNVEVLIYVFDVISAELDKDIHYYQSCLESILTYSPNAKVFCLIHKMDLIQEDRRGQVFAEHQKELQVRSEPIQIQAFQTSIWDETLYAAWARIIHCLIPNIIALQTNLDNFCKICGADEVVLFERTTFLVVANAATIHHPDVHRFEKISNIIKQFNLSAREQSHSKSMVIKGSSFTAFIDVLTRNTCVMIIISDPGITPAATQMNIAAARTHFEKLETMHKNV
ncbi:ras-related GTP-binding protein A-like protein [Syncephalastrum racemosum]|uniref:GTP-binding protein n=1 Tax=Syncephalastrum racemosum TaxID=13706 RepID=A0A1X2H560_SYNRA|nr:ras-related GTP-binding protein A-like protein [Syncephalastrum racemosum]